MNQSRAPCRSKEEWIQLIMECRNSGMIDRTWCEQHGIVMKNVQVSGLRGGFARSSLMVK